MVELDPLGWALLALRAVIWIAVLLALAGVALLRLGRSRAGVALAAGFALWASRFAVVGALDVLVPHLPGPPVLLHLAQAGLGLVLSLAAFGSIAFGIRAIPEALGAPGSSGGGA